MTFDDGAFFVISVNRSECVSIRAIGFQQWLVSCVQVDRPSNVIWVTIGVTLNRFLHKGASTIFGAGNEVK